MQVHGRLIIDNVMIAYETLHTMKTRMKGKVGSMALKLNMSKTYDRIEWRFLEETMRKLGFGDRWIKLVIECVTSMTYSCLINGQPDETIKPTRDDRVIFGKATTNEWLKIHEILNKYERVSGQLLNKQKTTTFFCSNAAMNVRK
ncbi:hypothetical protein F2P56_015043 [Juglans regia]|uniref:Uncharacterized protein LOC109003413 n=2 Tax=Juglans regia TaxID=51240 RepID=A0A2I4FZJ3_JUGRE|nr:uncharacterized protein LOC109003413 [Juglans regia]KAF5465009.1 hypothetical protein F2P56_015043 [Juglans regia]